MTEEQLAYIEANLAALSFDRGEDTARARICIGALIAEVRRLRAREEMRMDAGRLAAIEEEFDSAFSKGLGKATPADAFRLANHIPALLREVRRLREKLARARAQSGLPPDSIPYGRMDLWRKPRPHPDHEEPHR